VSDETQQNQGLPEAHSPAEISAERAAKIGATAAATEAAMVDLARQIAGANDPEAEQQSLMLDEIDEQQSLFSGPVRHVADQIAAARNGRGRPKGSQNKASRQFAETLMRMGYRHPGLNLAALANADPAALAVEMSGFEPVKGVTPHEHLQALAQSGLLKRDQILALVKSAYQLIKDANAELMPYFESKAPTQIAVNKQVMGVMIVGEMKAQPPTDTAVMDLTRFEKPE
jgi:hypothetical protein